MSTRARVTHKTKAERQRFSRWLRAGIWVFLGIFIFTVAGGVLAMSVHLGSGAR
uniref:Uncharacterized protein n=1 Tax=mine drainage metagenome TaxID=410659 RepID=E6Q697_9ZZZZ